jgi:hypothetical protein
LSNKKLVVVAVAVAPPDVAEEAFWEKALDGRISRQTVASRNNQTCLEIMTQPLARAVSAMSPFPVSEVPVSAFP